MECPDCKGKLKFIRNWRMDDKTEVIPLCSVCKVAHRKPELGWKILDEGGDKQNNLKHNS